MSSRRLSGTNLGVIGIIMIALGCLVVMVLGRGDLTVAVASAISGLTGFIGGEAVGKLKRKEDHDAAV